MTQKTNGSRRDFMKTSTAAVAGSTLLSSIASRSYAAADETIKLALVGCGGRGSGAANQALSTSGPVKLVAMADAFKDRLDDSHKNLAANHPDKVQVPEGNKFVGFDAYKQAIDSGVDMVILATPPGFRPPHFEYAVAQGKNIFMEKPVAVDGPGIRKVLAAAEEAKKKNLKIGVGLQRHHEQKYLETIERIHGGEIGDVVYMRSYWNGGGVWTRNRQPEQTEMEYQMRNWYYFNWLCGDHIVEQHIHNLDVCNWVMGGYPDYAQGMGGRQVRTGKDSGEIYDHHMVEFGYGKKWDTATRNISQCRHQPRCFSSVSEHVHGTKGMSIVSGGIIKDADGKTTWKFKGGNNPYQTEHDDLFHAIRNNIEYNEAENGAKSTMTAIMGRMATWGGQLIRWNQAIESEINTMPAQLGWNANPPTLPDANGDYPIAIPGVTTTV